VPLPSPYHFFRVRQWLGVATASALPPPSTPSIAWELMASLSDGPAQARTNTRCNGRLRLRHHPGTVSPTRSARTTERFCLLTMALSPQA